MAKRYSDRELKKRMKCSICKKEIIPNKIDGWAGGNNAQPINDGRCCDYCNDNVVIPIRILRATNSPLLRVLAESKKAEKKLKEKYGNL